MDADSRKAFYNARTLQLEARKRVAEKLVKVMFGQGLQRNGRVFQHMAVRLFEHDDDGPFQLLTGMRRVPVDIKEFLESPDFLGGVELELWPQIKNDLLTINSDYLTGNPQVTEYIDSGGTGCHAKGTRVVMYDGTTKAVENVRVGDQIMGPDSKPRTVLALARGRESMARISPNKGDPFVVNLGHILPLRRTRKTNAKTDNLAGTVVNITVRDYLSQSSTFKHLHKLWRTGCDFPLGSAHPLTIPPYILGSWLGDGHTGGAQITNIDPEVIDAWREYAQQLGGSLHTNGITHTVQGPCAHWDENPMRSALKDLNVLGEKHVPVAYLAASREDRLSLLAGFLDADGSLSCNGFEFSQRQGAVSRTIIRLARSLGFRVTTRLKRVSGTDYVRGFISGSHVHEIPTRIARKRAQPGNSNRAHDVEGFTVTILPEEDYYGFALDGDHLYLTDDFFVHHNTGKTLKASVTNAYQLYLLHCVESPQKMYGQAASTPIVFSMASSNIATTRDVLFRPFYDIVSAMPFFRKYTKWNKDKKSVLEFSNGLRVEPVSATTQGIIGRAVISAHIDEANYMAVVRGSARSAQGDGRRGVYDQAEQFYRAVTNRRASRFTSPIPAPGVIILSSSTRHTDDFLDRRISEVRTVVNPDGSVGERGVVVFRHKQYDVQPQERFSGERFRLLVGTAEYPSRVLNDSDKPGRDYPELGHIESIPIEYLYRFKHRPEDALRDVCGISTVNLSPFITQRHKIMEAVERWRAGGYTHAVARANVDLVDHGMPMVVPDMLDIDTTTRRFAHIDLSKNKDRCGIAVVRIDGFIPVPVSPGLYERLPNFVVEFAVSIQPSQAKELDYAAVRNWVVSLKHDHDIPVSSITYDGFNSTESVQALRRIGINSQVISMDRDDQAYQALRRALYEDRIAIPASGPDDENLLVLELTQLDQDQKTGKVDHPPKGSKDLADAVAGACWSALRSRHYRSEIYYCDAEGTRLTARQIKNLEDRKNIYVMGSASAKEGTNTE